MNSHLAAPTDVALDGRGIIYVVESSRNTLHLFAPDGTHMRSLDGLSRPISVAVDERGMVYVGNAGRRNVEVYGPGLELVAKLGVGDGEVARPSGIAVDRKGTVYVADSDRNEVRAYRSDGTFTGIFGPADAGGDLFQFPAALTVDEGSREILVADLGSDQYGGEKYGGARIQVFGLDGKYHRSFGGFGRGEGLLVKPLGIDVDDSGRVYVTDAFQNVVQVFRADGSYLTTMHDGENPLRTPLGIACGSRSGRIFVASLSKGRIDVYGISSIAEVRTLSVTVTGDGAGWVTSEPAGIDCGNECAARFESGTPVVLAAEPGVGSVFLGWGGACLSRRSCAVTLNSDLHITAHFAVAPGGGGDSISPERTGESGRTVSREVSGP